MKVEGKDSGAMLVRLWNLYPGGRPVWLASLSWLPYQRSASSALHLCHSLACCVGIVGSLAFTLATEEPQAWRYWSFGGVHSCDFGTGGKSGRSSYYAA